MEKGTQVWPEDFARAKDVLKPIDTAANAVRVTSTVDVVRGTDKSGRVTKWAYTCSHCPGVLGIMGNRSSAWTQALDHLKAHGAD